MFAKALLTFLAEWKKFCAVLFKYDKTAALNGKGMQRHTISFLGRDCPGVVAAVSRLFGELGCNIEAMTQTMLLGEFAAIFVVSSPAGLTVESLHDELVRGLAREEVDLSVLVRKAMEHQWGENIKCDPFVITVDGPDQPGIIGAMSRVFGRHGVNIENLKAIMGEISDGQALFVFEVMAPESVDIGRLRRELALEGQKFDLHVSVQHRDIFEAVNRVGAF